LRNDNNEQKSKLYSEKEKMRNLDQEES
jgi:hypothetical protein